MPDTSNLELLSKIVERFVAETHKPEYAALLVKELKRAIRDGDLDAIDSDNSFVLPTKEGKPNNRKTRDMYVFTDERFQAWYMIHSSRLQQRKPKLPKNRLTLEAIKNQEVPVEELIQKTRDRLRRNSERAAHMLKKK